MALTRSRLLGWEPAWAWAEECGSLHPCLLLEVPSKVYPCFYGKIQASTLYRGSLLNVFPVKLVQPFFPLHKQVTLKRKKQIFG